MFFSSNIKLLRKRKLLTQDDLARILNIKRSTLSGYENGVARPGIPALLIFSDYFKIAIDTLVRVDLRKLSGAQLLQLEQGADVFIRGGSLRVLSTSIDSQNRDNIELVTEKAKAGYTSGFSDPEYIRELPVFQLPFLSGDKKYRSFQISGDSMLPVPEGAWVVGEYVQDWTTIKDGTACIVLTLDEGIVFKIIENNIAEEGLIRAISLNTIYEPYSIHVVDIKEIWRFVRLISQELPSIGTVENNLHQTLLEIKRDVNQLKKKSGL